MFSSIALGLAFAQEDRNGTDKNSKIGPNEELAEKIAASVAAIEERARQARRLKAAEEFESIIDTLNHEYELPAEASATLEKAAEKAIGNTQEKWWASFERFQNTHLSHSAPAYHFDLRLLKRQLSNVEMSIDLFQEPESVMATLDPAWLESLEKTLGKDNAKKEIEKQKSERTDREKRLATALDKAAESKLTQFETELNFTSSELADATGLDSSQKETLTALSNQVLSRHLERWKEETGSLLKLTRETGWPYLFNATPPIDPSNDATWNHGLATLLTEDQKTKWKTDQDRILAELNEKITEVLKSSDQDYQVLFQEKMDETLEDLTSTLSLPPSSLEELKKAAAHSVEQAIETRHEFGRQFLLKMPRSRQEAIFESKAINFRLPADSAPEQQAAWKNALETVLTPEQSATWQAELSRQEDELNQQLENLIDGTAESHRIQFATSLDPQISDLINSLNLDTKRADAFREAGRKAIGEGIKKWKETAHQWLEGVAPEERHDFANQNYFPLSAGDSTMPEQQPAWKQAFTKILTPEEKALWNSLAERREKARQEVIQELLVAEVEEWIGFNPEQWEALVRICRVPGESLSRQLDRQNFYIRRNEITDRLQLLKEKDLRDILTATQLERWHKAIELLEPQSSPQTQQDSAKVKPPEGAGPLYVEATLTDCIYQRTREVKEDILLKAFAEIEICANAAGLSSQIVSRLQTSAKGAAEVVLNQWDSEFTRYLRSRTNGAKPETIHQLISNEGRYRTRYDDPFQTNLWKHNLALKLTEEEKQRWDNASKVRKQARSRAVINLVAVYFESQLGLDAGQTEKLTEEIVVSLETYGPDIERYFSSHSSPWYLRHYTMGLPLMGIPEKELKTLLKKNQFKDWEERYRPSAANYWNTIKTYHQRRLDAEKKEKS